jgi:hypothetical protein
VDINVSQDGWLTSSPIVAGETGVEVPSSPP